MVCDVCMALNSSLCVVLVLLQVAVCVAGRREIGAVTALSEGTRLFIVFHVESRNTTLLLTLLSDALTLDSTLY